MLDSQLSSHNQTPSRIPPLHTDLPYLVPTSLHMQARAQDHRTRHEVSLVNTPPTTHKQTTMPLFELPSQPSSPSAQQQLADYRKGTSLQIP